MSIDIIDQAGHTARQQALDVLLDQARAPLHTEISELRHALEQANQNDTANRAEIMVLQAAIRTLLEAQEPQPDPAVLPFWGAPVWRDEFDAGITPSRWNVRSRSDLGLLNDTAIPDAGMVTAVDGTAHLRAEWLTTPEPRTGGQGILTHRTGYMDHLNRNPGNILHEQKYGRWEARLKPPTGPNTLGALAAFWLRNRKTGEIDIFESWGFGAAPKPNGQKDGTSTTTVHNLTSGGTGYQKYAWTLEDELRKKGITVPKVYTRLVTVAFEYTPDYAATVYDGVEVFRATPKTHPMLWDPRYFDSPLHVRVNLHVGPSKEYYGIPDPTRQQLTQPLDFQLEHVRIWALPTN